MLPLHAAIESMNLSEISSLISDGVNVNEQDPSIGGFTPLHLAVDIECEEACRCYDAGSLNAVPKSDISRLLLAAGADPCIADFNGLTPIQLAAARNHKDALLEFEHTQSERVATK